MQKVSILGVDLAKASFTVCGLDEKGTKVLTKEYRTHSFKNFLVKGEKMTVIMEACGGAHYWSRFAKACGHETKIVAPQKVVGFRKNNKNDKNDAYAICIAGNCPGMEFVPTKSVDQQDVQAVLRTRGRLISNQTALVNSIRGTLSEYGVTVSEGIQFIRAALSDIANNPDCEHKKLLTPITLELVKDINKELIEVTERIEKTDKMILRLTKENDQCIRLQAVPGIGPLIAATIVSTLINPEDYKNGRQFAASIGLTPKHVQTGGTGSKPIQLGISKCGNAELRSLLVQGAMSTLNAVRVRQDRRDRERASAAAASVGNDSAEASDKNANPTEGRGNAQHPSRQRIKKKGEKKVMSKSREEWILKLYEEKGTQKTAVALANKTARMIHAILKSGGTYQHELAYSAHGQKTVAA
ncbi:MAG: IS110 family transposase [Proteobacteria bacterium]|nr:IS110 family transposase [Pseudomonadota bacterium]